MTEGALKTGRGLKSNSMHMVEKGTCTAVFFILKDRLNIFQKALLVFFCGLGSLRLRKVNLL